MSEAPRGSSVRKVLSAAATRPRVAITVVATLSLRRIFSWSGRETRERAGTGTCWRSGGLTASPSATETTSMTASSGNGLTSSTHNS